MLLQVIRHTDALGPPGVFERFHFRPFGLELLLRGGFAFLTKKRTVDQVQVDVVEAELLEGAGEGELDGLAAPAGGLGRNE